MMIDERRRRKEHYLFMHVRNVTIARFTALSKHKEDDRGRCRTGANAIPLRHRIEYLYACVSVALKLNQYDFFVYTLDPLGAKK